ncbi:S8 family serine peptidase [Heliobacterium chlorum]|uniref:S8 family serine peptidase n=1 Tax=Heliobacterium chlorum TaxID=2698 RepID=A0ABR7T490_HELCL|nr:S8 family serine peptidase [Heliobacterium chlorum]MBC9784496.1 S8 family serine peptidase [Heliobacterium chlorum]
MMPFTEGKAIDFDQGHPTLLNDRTRDIIGASLVAVPEVVHSTGIQGQGEVIAIADSGLDSGDINHLHPDFQNKPGRFPKVLNLKSWAYGPTEDTTGHGTHMAGIIAGTGAASQGKYKGMAPEASLYIQGIIDSQGQVSPPEDVSRLYEPAYKANAHIHVDGWGTPGNKYNRIARETDRFLNRYTDLLVIFGAGNGGPQPNSLTCEANSKNALVVGASSSVRPAGSLLTTEPQQIAELSSRGPTADGRIKPDLTAPGVGIVSTAPRVPGMADDEAHLYQRMQGTSMAAATAGGAAALLRQYFREEDYPMPSSALLKAALINGARSQAESMGQNNETNSQPNSEGFGILDVGRTILALREKSFTYVDNDSEITNGETKTFDVKPWTESAPVKVTLSWIDPVKDSGELVNDLDLTVTGPDGVLYTGNAHMGMKNGDHKNNVEQVIIPHPVSGRYRITVTGSSITVPHQRFALVMGQPLVEEPVVTYSAKNQDDKPLRIVFNDSLAKNTTGLIPVGAQVYDGPQNRYGIARAVRLQGADVASIGGKNVLVPRRNDSLFQGYSIDPKASIQVNGKTSPLWPTDAKGSSTLVWLHPPSQKAMKIEAAYTRVDGKLEEWLSQKEQLTLIGQKKVYRARADTPVEIINETLGEADVPGPIFGNRLSDSILPGSDLRLTIDPQTFEVTNIQVLRTVVQGLVTKTNQNREFNIEGFGTISVMPGSTIRRDGEEIELKDLRMGDYVQANLLSREYKAYGVIATERALWGKIIYVSAKDGQVYFADQFQRLHRSLLNPGAAIQRWNMPVEMSAIPIGGWAWITLGLDNRIQNVRVVETDPVSVGLIQRVDLSKKEILTDQNVHIRLFSLTSLNYDGLPIPAEWLHPGQTVEWVPVFEKADTNQRYAASLSIKNTLQKPNEKPSLTASVLPMDQKLLILGKTNGKDIWIYPSLGNEKIHVPVQPDGYYAWAAEPRLGETGFQIVAASLSGQVTGRYLAIPAGRDYSFKDVSGHWAEEALNKTRRMGLIRGYPDGTFQPDRSIRRQDFNVMFSRLFGMEDYEKATGMSELSQSELIQIAQSKMSKSDIPPRYWPSWIEGEFGPEGYQAEHPATRAMAVVLLQQVIQAIEHYQKEESGQ